jgi:hypothetical protein
VNESFVGPRFTLPDQNGNQKTWHVFQAPYGQLHARSGTRGPPRSISFQ